MANVYDQFFDPKPQGSPPGNPYDTLFHGPVADEQEQDVISRVNNPKVESPRNFGLVEVPATIANEFWRPIVQIPKELGVGVLETGELAQSQQGKTIGDVAATSFATRLMKNLAEGDTGLKGLVQTIWGTEKDVILSALPEAAPKAMRRYGKAMIEQNDAATNWMLGTPKQGVPADIGAGFGSVARTIGAWYAGGAGAAGYMMGLAVNSDAYQEARKKLDPEDAAAAAFSSAYIQGKLEHVGTGVFTAVLAGSGFFKKVLFRSAEQGLEEVSQQIADETVMDVADVRDLTFEQKLHNILYAGAIGLVVGAPTSVVFTKMEDISKGYGIDPKEIKSQLDAFIKNKDAVVEGAAEIIGKEASGITKDEPARAEAIKEMKRVIADHESEQKAVADGKTQDPKVAAGILLKSPKTSEETKAVIKALPPGFTMQQLREASKARKEAAVAPIKQKAQQDRIDAIQNETDDIEMNLQREVTALAEDKTLVDTETKGILENWSALINERRKTLKPKSLTEFVKSIGGVREQGGELAFMGMEKRGSARNDKYGIGFDEAGLQAFEQGYFDERPTEAEFIAALESDFKGTERIVSRAEEGNQSRLDEIDSTLSQIDKALGERDIGTDARARLVDLRKRAAANKKLDKAISSETKKRQMELHRLDAAKKKVEKSPPKILADKLKTFIAGMRKGGALQKQETKEVQTALIEMIEESGLDANDRAKFIRTIKNAQTIEQLEKKLPEIQASVERLLEASQRRDVVSKIKSLLAKTKVTKQSGKPVGKYGAETQVILDSLREAMALNQQEAALRLGTSLASSDMPTPEQALLNRALAIAAGDESVAVKDMQEFLDDATALIDDGKTGRKNSQFARAIRIGSMKIQAADEITKGENLDIIDETTWSRKLERLGNNIKALQDGWLFGWYDIPDILFGKSSLRDALRVGEQVSQGKKIVREKMEKIEIAAQEAFGFTKRKQWLNKIIEDSEVIDLGEMPDASGHPMRVQFTKAQMRKLWMEWQDPSLHKTLFSKDGGNKYTEDMVGAIMQHLTPEDRAFAQAQMDIYQEFYQKANEVYAPLYGVNLPHNENYSPIRRDVGGEIETGVFLADQQYRHSVTSGSLISRVKNLRPLRKQSDVETYQQHIMEMSHFIAFAEKIQQINGVFGDGRVRKAIEKKHGKAMVRIIDEYIAVLVRGGPQRADMFGRVVNTLNRNFAVSILGGKLAMIPKQLTSFVASAAEMPSGAWAAGIADFSKNPAAAIRVLSQSEMLKARGHSPEQDIAKLGKSIDWNVLKKKQRFDDIMLLPIKLGDRGAIYVGGWPIYRHAIQQGKTHEQALLAFETWFETTQQSGSIDQISLAQAASPFVRTFTMFRSAPAAYLRAEIRALRHWRRDEISTTDFAKKLAVYHILIPTLFQFVANGFDWDDEDQARAAILGPIDGYFIIGDIISRAAGGFKAGEPTFTAFGKDIVDGIEKVVKSEWDMEEIAEGIKDLAKGAGAATGVPVGQAQNMLEGIDDIQDGEVGKGTKRVMGWPKGALENND